MGKENPIDYLPPKELLSQDAPHRNTYYEINDGVFFVPGIERGVICDTNSGAVFSVNRAAKNTILGEEDNPKFKENLVAQGHMSGEQPRPIEREKGKFNLEFVWFEIISDDCNERCLHCYADSMPPTYRKTIALEDIPILETSPEKKINAQRWKDLIAESGEIGAESCQFIGGEPFLWRGEKGETVLDLAEQAMNSGFNFVEIFTNGTLILKKDILRIRDLGLNIAISLYSDDEQIHDEITRTPGSFKKTKKTLELLGNAGISTRVETVLMKQNQHTVESTNSFIEGMGFSHRSPDVLRPKGRGDDLAVRPDEKSLVKYGLMLGPNFVADKGFFQRSVDGHNCLAGKVTVTDNGDVLPCIFSRGNVMGNVLESGNLEKVLKEEVSDIWETNKDDILVCQDCEYRYVCFDCRPISEGASEGNGDYRTAPYPRCTYNPYKGEWGNGTWKVDKDGSAYYDESLGDVINETRSNQIPLVGQRDH